MRRQVTLIVLSVLIVSTGLYANPFTLRVVGFPFTVDLVSADTGIVTPVQGVPLPVGLQPGDAIDLPALDRDARIAVSISAKTGSLPRGQTYVLMVRRPGSADRSVQVASIELDQVPSVKWTQPLLSMQSIIIALVALLVLWRGRDLAAKGVLLWTAGNLIGGLMNTTDPIDVLDVAIGHQGSISLARVLVAWTILLLARAGFYITMEASVRSGLKPRALVAWRGFFLVSLAGTAIVALGGPLLYVATGSAELLRGVYGLVVTASYLPSVLLLIVGYRTAEAALQPRLRWMLWSSLLWIAGILLTNEPQWGLMVSLVLGLGIFSSLAIIGIIYAVLRHRLVDVAVVLDQTLVYGATTMLVIGAIAAVNNLALRAALGEGTGLLLQIVVPLSLGIVLGRVRHYMDMLVERVFFRKRYLAMRSLEGFMARCGHIDGTEHLLGTAVKEVASYSGSPGVSLYQASGGRYECIASAGDLRRPKHLPMDDPAMVEARAGHEAVETSNLESALGPDSCIFPVSALGVLQGVLVCVNRPGEHYAADEKRLVGRTMRDVGSAWRILQARDNRDFVREVARGTLSLANAKSKARSIVAAWDEG